jgi:hypothetical protein
MPLSATLLVNAQPRSPSTENRQSTPTDEQAKPDIRVYTNEQLESILDEGNGIDLSNAVIQKVTTLDDSTKQNLTFRNVTFEDDLLISGIYNQITFEHCHFKRNVDFYLVSTLSLTLRNSEFLGTVSLNLAVTGLTIRRCEFAKAVNLYGTRLDPTKSVVNMTWLNTKEPIRVFWSQFGEKWLHDLKVGAYRLGDPTEKESNIRQVLAELEFWKDNFIRLGHLKDAAEVNYEIIAFTRENNITIEPRRADWWLSYLLSWPSRYGTRPYRPIWLALIVIVGFAVLFTIRDPFVAEDEKVIPKPRYPRLLFSFMYSVDTFLPVFDVTGVKKWGWQLKSSYRWVGVIERLFGLLILYSAAYSLTFYVL